MDEHLSYIQVAAGSRPAWRTENTVGGCVEEEFQSLEHIIYACTQYEYMFWNMAWDGKMIEEMN